VRTPPHLPCGRRGLRAEAERPHAAAPLLVMPAFEPGWDAIFFRCRRLRRRARHPPSLSPLAVRRRPVRHRRAMSVRPRRVRVACLSARARAGHGARKRAPQHAGAVALKARPGLGPLFRAYAVLAVLAVLAAVHRMFVSTVAMENARTVAKGKHSTFLVALNTTLHPDVFAPPNRGRRAHRRPWQRAGLRRAPVRAPSRPAPRPLGLPLHKRYPARRTRPLVLGTPTPAPRHRCRRSLNTPPSFLRDFSSST
jgi:hypothetical protein